MSGVSLVCLPRHWTRLPRIANRCSHKLWQGPAMPSTWFKRLMVGQTRRVDDMPLRDFLNDRVTLIKKDGRRFDNLPASVQSDNILTNDPKIPIEDGDSFERQTPSGIT